MWQFQGRTVIRAARLSTVAEMEALGCSLEPTLLKTPWVGMGFHQIRESSFDPAQPVQTVVLWRWSIYTIRKIWPATDLVDFEFIECSQNSYEYFSYDPRRSLGLKPSEPYAQFSS